MEAEIKRLQSGVARIKEDVGEIKQNIRELRARMEAATDAIAAQRVMLAELNGKIDAQGIELRGKIEVQGLELRKETAAAHRTSPFP